MKTTILPDGTVIRLVDIERISVEKHWFSKSYYVEIQTKKRHTHDLVSHVSEATACMKRSELQTDVAAAHEEINAYEQGLQDGHKQGYARGRQSGLKQGKQEGSQEGWNAGHDSGISAERSRILRYLAERREDLVHQEQQGNNLPPAERRRVRANLSLVRELISWLEPATDYEPEAHRGAPLDSHGVPPGD